MLEYLAEGVEPLAAITFTVLGAFAELNAAGSLAAGDTVLGLWFGYVGAVALYAGLVVVADLPARLGSASADG